MDLEAQIPRSYGDITFLLPSAYSMQGYPDAAVMQYLDENNKSYLMFIFPAVLSSGNPQKDYSDAWNKMYGAFSKTESGSIPSGIKKGHPKGWEYYEGGSNCIHNNGRTFYGWLSIQVIGDRLVAFGSAAPTQAQFGYNLSYTNTVLNSIDLAGYHSRNLLARKSSFEEGISGVWQGVKSAAMLDGSTGRAIKYIVFYDDSVFCYEMPAAGLDSMDRAGNEAWRKGYWGTYVFNGRTGTVNFGTYKNEPLGLAGSNLTFFDLQYEKLRPIDRLVFEGTYTSKTDRKDWWRGYEPLVRFNKDGTFEDRSALFDVDDDISTTCPTQKPGKGKYLCQNYSLVLIYDDGRKGQIALYTIDWKKPGSPEYISLGKGLLKKKK
jgi:hypothetical protein